MYVALYLYLYLFFVAIFAFSFVFVSAFPNSFGPLVLVVKVNQIFNTEKNKQIRPMLWVSVSILWPYCSFISCFYQNPKQAIKLSN